MRSNGQEIVGGRLINGYDYHRQAWVKDGRYVSCAHLDNCGCYGKVHAGECTPVRADVERP